MRAHTDTLARIGGDEFGILIGGETEQLEVAAERLRVALRDPLLCTVPRCGSRPVWDWSGPEPRAWPRRPTIC